MSLPVTMYLKGKLDFYSKERIFILKKELVWGKILVWLSSGRTASYLRDQFILGLERRDGC